MSSLFSDLLAFFGISSAIPQNLGEFMPWFLSVLVALGLFLFCFRMIKSIVLGITHSGRF